MKRRVKQFVPVNGYLVKVECDERIRRPWWTVGFYLLLVVALAVAASWI